MLSDKAMYTMKLDKEENVNADHLNRLFLIDTNKLYDRAKVEQVQFY